MIRNLNTSAFKNRTVFVGSTELNTAAYRRACFIQPTKISRKTKHFEPKINGRSRTLISRRRLNVEEIFMLVSAWHQEKWNSNYSKRVWKLFDIKTIYFLFKCHQEIDIFFFKHQIVHIKNVPLICGYFGLEIYSNVNNALGFGIFVLTSTNIYIRFKEREWTEWQCVCVCVRKIKRKRWWVRKSEQAGLTKKCTTTK